MHVTVGRQDLEASHIIRTLYVAEPWMGLDLLQMTDWAESGKLGPFLANLLKSIHSHK